MRLRAGLLLLMAAVISIVWFYPGRVARERVEIRQTGQDIRLYRHGPGTVETIPLEEYVVGVVAAEMPASAPLEALKAQAVAARTYSMRRIISRGVANNPHPGTDICDEPKHSQAYLSREDLKKSWGPIAYYRYYYKVRRAVAETSGLVITYKGQLIDPVYHASCGGCTENARDVWKFDIPYLKSVQCPYDLKTRPVESRSFTLAQLQGLISPKNTTTSASEDGKGEGQLTITITDVTATGRPKEVAVSGKPVSATIVRERLGLKSTRFTWNIKEDRVLFTTVGYGHGVGLCQNGAMGMAENGCGFGQILTHYYSGVQVVKY
ncbi:MAG: stage II sporulation protein D [Bacillota bacterium]